MDDLRRPLSDLFKAVASNRPRTIERLLEANPALLNQVHPTLGYTALWSAFSKSKREQAVDVLLIRGADVHLSPLGQRKTLLTLALENYPRHVPRLLAQGIRPRERAANLYLTGSDTGLSDLDLACQRRRNLVPLLLEHGANPNVNPVVFASSPLAVLLRSAVMDPPENGERGFEHAVALIERGANPNGCAGPQQPAWFWWWHTMVMRSDDKDRRLMDCHQRMLERIENPLMRWKGGTFLHHLAAQATQRKWEGKRLADFLKPIQKWLGPERFSQALLLETSFVGSEPSQCPPGMVALSFLTGKGQGIDEHAFERARVWEELGAPLNETNHHGYALSHVLAAKWWFFRESPGFRQSLSDMKIDWNHPTAAGDTPERLALDFPPDKESAMQWRAFMLECQWEPTPSRVAPRL